MPSTSPDYEQLRNHLGRPVREHPAARQEPVAPPEPARPPTPPDATGAVARVSVMEWLSVVGRAVARRLRRAPHSAMARLHPPE
jgi:hypothetical protein